MRQTSGRGVRGFLSASIQNNQAQPLESLETRRMLCMDHVMTAAPIELRPDLIPSIVSAAKGITQARAGKADIGAGPALLASDPADIVWINRANTTAGGAGDTDRFGATFGTSAPLARAVVDAVIIAYERMIGSFNYATPGATYNLTVNMNASGSGFGASASLSQALGGKPKAGSINMGRGTLTADPNDTNNWFVDPTPFEHSEFAGSIVNAFSGDATPGGPAAGRNDFYTVVAAEMTHCMGLFGNNLPGWAALTTNTGSPDNVIGFRYVFNGPSIKHLLTSNNANSQDWGSAVHSAEPNSSVTWNGDLYIGAQDQGNAIYETSRRYYINNTFALMFKDAYGYASVDPAKWGTSYVILNETTKTVTVRGGTGTVDDIISITRSGDTLTFSVDPKTDVPGTGHLPGHGDLPAFVTQFDISQVNSILLGSSSGNDVITIGANLGVPINLDGGAGTDSLIIMGTDANETFGLSSSGLTGALITSGLSGFESITINAGGGHDVITVNAAGLPPLTVNGQAGNDTLNLTNVNGTSPIFDGGADANILNVNSGAYTVNADLGTGMTVNVNGGSILFNVTQHLAGLNVAAGATATLAAGGNKLIRLGALGTAGKLDLKDNDLIFDYSGSSPLAGVVAAINSARSGGAWNGNGLTSSTAGAAVPAITTLAAIEAAEYRAMRGAGTPFAGESVSGDSVLVKYTYYGDTDFNGQVNFDDYSRIDAGFLNGRTGWANGDFNGDGVINFDDYSLIDQAFLSQFGVL